VDALLYAALSNVLTDAKSLLHALDRGYLAYRADSPESAFVAELRRSIAIAEHERKRVCGVPRRRIPEENEQNGH